MSPRTLTLQELIDKAVDENAYKGSRNYLGASIIADECERKLWYGFRWYTDIDFPPRIRRRFETGHRMEDRVVARLREAGFSVDNENPRARNPAKQYGAEYGPLGGLFRGHLDGIVTAPGKLWRDIGAEGITAEHPVLLEVKVLASAKYEYTDDTYTEIIGNKKKGRLEGRYFELARKGVKKAQQKHFGQMQAYMGLSRATDRNGKVHYQKWGLSAPLDHALYVGVNADTEQWYAEHVPFSPRWYDRIIGRATRIIRSPTPPERITDNPASWSCTFCDYHSICHGVAEEKKSCRSCAHSEVKLPSDPGFYGRTAQWLCTHHGSGCGDFTACDAWQSIESESPMF